VLWMPFFSGRLYMSLFRRGCFILMGDVLLGVDHRDFFVGVLFSGVPPIYGVFCLYFTSLCSSCAGIGF